MSSRVFQGIVLQMKDCADRYVGVMDADGTVVACNELTLIGERWPVAVAAINDSESDMTVCEGRTFKSLAGLGAQFDYAAFASGSDDRAALVCSMATVALNGAKAYYEEKHDRATFIKSVISDNVLMGDIYVRAKELHFQSEAPRAVLLVRQINALEMTALETVQNLFPDKQADFVLSVNETDIVVIKQLPEGAEARDLYKTAKQIEDALVGENMRFQMGFTLKNGVDIVLFRQK